MDLSVANRALVTEALRHLRAAIRGLERVIQTRPDPPITATVEEAVECAEAAAVTAERVLDD